MRAILTALILATIPPGHPVIVDQVDVIEWNHVHSPETGQETLSQIVYWRWCENDSTHHVAAWRMVHAQPSARIRRAGREWIETREDGRCRREIRSPRFVETWTLHDPEIEDRSALPASARVGLKPLPPAE